VKRWVPELAQLPISAWSGRGHETAPMLPLFSGEPYPSAVVDHAREARSFLERYKEFVQRKL